MKKYTEEEVKVLLKKQREICAQQVDKFRFNKLYVKIQLAPSPKLY
jgi:hypothetical protein